MSLFRLLTDLEGRIGRAQFWLGSAIVAVALVVIREIAPVISDDRAHAIIAFAGAFALFPWAALAAKRAQDRGGSALFGVVLICAIVLPDQFRSLLSSAWAPSLQTISLIAWIVALIDLGLMPSAAEDKPVAGRAQTDKSAAWTRFPPPSPTRPTPSR